MSYWNRMFSSVWAGKRKTIVILCIAIVLSFILMVTISIRSASEKSVKKIRNSIETSVSLQTQNTYNSDILASNEIEKSQVELIEKLPNVKSCNYSIRSVAYAGGFTPVVTEEQKSAMEEKQREAKESGGKVTYVPPYDIRVEADRSTQDSPSFISGYYKMIFGNMIEEKDEHVCLMFTKVATDNNLTIGSKIKLKGPTGKEVELKIVGFYATTSYMNRDIYDPYQNSENLIFTDTKSALELNDNTNVALAEFKMKDPEANKEFVRQVIKMNPENQDKYIFAFNDTNYRLMSSSLQILITITNLVLIGAIFLGGIILTLLVAISMRDRDYEIGILLAMGEQKYKIILQMIGELFLPILVGACIGTLITIGMNGTVNHLIASAADVKVTISAVTVLEMLGGIILINLIGAILTIYKVNRYQPKQILMHIE